MPIPTTCPGCQAAFEVPDNLAGKTIRCTSCKTQLAVPAARAAAALAPAPAANGKKPFGWAGGKAPAPAAPEPEPLPLDDDEDAPLVAELEEPAPARKKKGAVVGAVKATPAAKRRRDDDDDEDDDDTPRRKGRKTGGASGAMYAMIGGGVLALAALVGGGVWLLSGDKKKDDTANKDDTTPAAEKTEPKPDPTKGDSAKPEVKPGTGRPTRPGTGLPTRPVDNNPLGGFDKIMGGDKIGTEGPWARFEGDGFSAEFPGTPDTRTVSEGPMTMRVAGVARKDGNSVVAMSMQLPDAALVGQALARINTQFAGKSGATVREATVDGNPGKEIDMVDEDGSGTIRVAAVKDRVYMFVAGGETKGGKPGLPKASIARFMNSVKITYKGDGGNVAVGGPGDPVRPKPPGPKPEPKPEPPKFPEPKPEPKPPEPKPDPGQPPAPVPPPFGGAGGEIVGKLHKEVNPFFAGAFDTANKELVVVGKRVDKSAVRGTLQRYSVPGFKSLGTVHVPNVGTRAAIDPKKGLLYVATATAATPVAAKALDDNQFDRGAYVGDVAVYDLAAVRKAEEKSEVKPVATVPVGRVIRDLVLSEDGKSLYVLSTAQPAAGAKGLPKAQLAVVDTAERKLGKPKDLPEPAWQMFRAADGGKIYVTGRPDGNTPPSLMAVDPATLALTPSVPLPKSGVWDAAPVKDGRIVLSVPGGNNAPYGLEVVEPSGQTGPAVKAAANAVSNNGYVGVTPDGKYLVVSSHHPNQNGPGVDVYEATDTSMGERKVASLKKAGTKPVGGAFLVAPEGNYVVFLKGEVLKVDDLGNTPAVPAPPGGGVNPVPPGGIVPPGGVGIPPGGVVPPGGPGRPPGEVIPGQPPGGIGIPPGGIPPKPGQPGQPGGLPKIDPVPPGGIGIPPGQPGKPPVRPDLPGRPQVPPGAPGGVVPLPSVGGGVGGGRINGAVPGVLPLPGVGK